MQWYFHKTTTFALVYAVSGDLTASIVAGVASIIPDAIEMPFMGLIPHRTITHWPYLYLVLIAGFGCAWNLSGHIGFQMGLFVSIGCLLHVAEDALSKTGVPYGWPFGKKRGLDFYKVHTFREVCTAVTIIVPCFCGAYFLGWTETSYITEEAQRAFYAFGDFSRFFIEFSI